MIVARRAAVVVACVTAAAVLAGCGGDTLTGRYDSTTTRHGRVGYPLAGPPPNGFATHAAVGEVFTNGQLIIFNVGHADLTVLKVTPTLTGDGLRYLGARIAGMDRKLGSNQESPGFPPREPFFGPLGPAHGSVLHTGRPWARRGVEVLLGFKVIAPGRSTVPKVSITYRDHTGVHTASWTSTMAVCTSPKKVRCPQEYGDFHS